MPKPTDRSPGAAWSPWPWCTRPPSDLHPQNAQISADWRFIRSNRS